MERSPLPPPPDEAGAERARTLVLGLLCVGVAAAAVLLAPVELHEVAPVFGVLWLVNLVCGVLCLLTWVFWNRLEPRRRCARIRFEARIARSKVRRHLRLGHFDPDEASHLIDRIDRNERTDLRRVR